ncbi:DsbE family thiol:disulfide interchange protein [Pseudaestuariivita atlantica]|uniref:Thiol:disulfide interchange protein n=1 Tax=Pseudaestuariivita atlantica TaxID=1317121 RepID=A0A0L1JUD7_9RHOB|nr:DsbE family thiol:disulfide interchange protein [Pseudaestuariivita atlantica]KNG95376.1 thiol:disulfide interchange protein [Pseudaestuariivita atlantica]
MARGRLLMLLPPILFAAFAATAYFGMTRDGVNTLPSQAEGQPAPAVLAEPFTGEPGFDDADLRDGKVKIVNFWASWCAPCRVEHPILTRLAEEGVPIYGVNYKDSPANATGFLAELGNPYVGLKADPKGRMAIEWGVYGLPETFVLSGDGTVILRFAGPVTSRVLEETVRPALETAAAR